MSRCRGCFPMWSKTFLPQIIIYYVFPQFEGCKLHSLYSTLSGRVKTVHIKIVHIKAVLAKVSNFFKVAFEFLVFQRVSDLHDFLLHKIGTDPLHDINRLWYAMHFPSLSFYSLFMLDT